MGQRGRLTARIVLSDKGRTRVASCVPATWISGVVECARADHPATALMIAGESPSILPVTERRARE